MGYEGTGKVRIGSLIRTCHAPNSVALSDDQRDNPALKRAIDRGEDAHRSLNAGIVVSGG